MQTIKPLPTQERLHELLDYNPETGVFTWKHNKGRTKAGSAAGYKHPSGYITIKVDGSIYRSHRLAWMYVYGNDPGKLQLDHINGDKADNKITNLRLATQSQNNGNKPSSRGYCFDKKAGKWKAQIKYQGKGIHLGNFDTKELARACYERARNFFFQEFSPTFTD